MNRKHTIKEYLDIIYKLKKNNSEIRFSSDFIIGYPGETDKDFEETLKLLKEIKYINTYSFIFSPRPGTPAANMEKVDYETAKKRLVIFQKIAEEIKIKYRKNLLHKRTSVLFENKMKNGPDFFGRDPFSNSIIVKSNQNLKGQIKSVKIISGNQNTLYGEIDDVLEKENFAA